MTKKVLISDKVHHSLPVGLEKLGYHVDYDTGISTTQLREVIHDYVGVIINSKITVDQMMLDRGLNLRFVGRLGSGLEIIDVDYATQKNIVVINTPSGNSNAVAEHAFGMLLSLTNNLHSANLEVKRGQWLREKNRGIELIHKSIGIYAFGHTGSSFAQKWSGWQVSVLGYDKYKTDYAMDMAHVQEVDVDTICRQSDILSFHLPLHPETKNLVDSEFLNKCKPGVVIINTSRGQVVHLPSLISALESGHVSGACLDVLPNEKMQAWTKEEQRMYDRLFAMENVILSPHIAGWTHRSLKKIATIMLDKIARFSYNSEKQALHQ